MGPFPSGQLKPETLSSRFEGMYIAPAEPLIPLQARNVQLPEGLEVGIGRFVVRPVEVIVTALEDILKLVSQARNRSSIFSYLVLTALPSILGGVTGEGLGGVVASATHTKTIIHHLNSMVAVGKRRDGDQMKIG